MMYAFPASAQVFGQMMRSNVSGRFIEAPRFIEQEMRDAEDAIKEKQYSDAVVRLGDLLQREPSEVFDEDSLAGQDFFLIKDSRKRVQHQSMSLLRRARDTVGGLPPSALETYELQYGPLARRTLDDAAAARDWHRLHDVRRKFFHTKAGYEASYILAQKEMVSGHPLGASLLLDDVVSTPQAVAHLGDALKSLHEAAMHLSGRANNDQVAESYAVNQQTAGGQPEDYALFGGLSNRNGNSGGQMPLGNLRWDLPTTASPREAQVLDEKANELIGSGKLPPPSWMPIRVGDQLLMRTTDRLFGVDYRTGKRVWQFPWYATTEDINDDQFPLDTIIGDEGPGNLLMQRVWNDLPYGQVTSDGKRVFMITDLSEVEIAQLSPIMGIRGTRPADNRTNTLVALDLETEGKLQWRLGKGADQASTLSDAFFLGPPLPLDGRLYVMVEMAGDILLVCLDPASGDEVWRQQLVAVETGSVDFDAVRRIAGASPTYHEGVLICPTGAGATVALDLGDRMLRWGVSYPRKTDVNQMINRQNNVEPNQLMQRWHNGLATATGTTVLVTPIEADRLFCFDLVTGASKFTDKPREQMRYLAGARDDKFILVGSREVGAFEIETGAPVWRTSGDLLAAGQQIAGYGVFGPKDYFVPTTANQLIRISLDDGAIVGKRTTRYPLGNLVAVGGEVISQAATRLSVAYGEASLEPLVNSVLKNNPQDYEALVRKAELMIQREKRREALDLLRRAAKIDSDSDEVHMLSVAAMLGILREDPNGEPELVKQLDSMIDQPNQRAEFLALLVRGAVDNKNADDAVERLISLSSLIAGESLLGSAADEIVNDISRQCSLDSWLAARFQQVIDFSEEDQRKKIASQIDEYMSGLLQGSSSLLERSLRHFESVEPEAARRELARRFRDDRQNLKLERLALGTSNATWNDIKDLSDDSVLMLADAFIAGSRGEDALGVLEILQEREVDDLEELLAMAERGTRKIEWGDQVGLDWQSQQLRSRGIITLGQRLSRTIVSWGETFRGWRLVSEGANTIALRDPMGQVHGIPLDGLSRRDEGDKEAIINGGVMIVVRPGEIAAIDLYRVKSNQVSDSVLWRRSFSGDGASIAKRRNEMNSFNAPLFWFPMNSSTARTSGAEFRVGPVLGDRLLVLQGGDLLAVDLANSETLWRNSNAQRSGTIVANEEQVAVVSPNTKTVEFFDKLDGSSMRSERWVHGKIWHSLGKHVLCELPSDDNKSCHVSIVDPFTGDVLQELETSTASRSIVDGDRTFGQIVGGRYMVLLSSSGKLTVWDVLHGIELSDLETKPLDGLQRLHAMELDGQLILLPMRTVDQSKLPKDATLQTRHSSNHQTTHAVYAVSLKDGSLNWEVQFDEYPWGCTLSQPASTPVLLLTRAWATYSTTSARTVKLDVQAIDVKTGDVIHERLGRKVSSRSNEIQTRITVQPTQKRVVSQLSGEILTYHFGRSDEEFTEEP